MNDVPLSVVLGGGAFLTTLFTLAAVHAALEDRPEPAPALPPSAVFATPQPAPGVRVLGLLARPEEAAERQGLEDELAQAGFRARGGVATYLALRTVLALVTPVISALIVRPSGLTSTLLVVLEGVAVGYYLPAWVVYLRRRRRQRRIQRAVPNMLDMLVSCVEAGLGVDVALRHVSREIRTASPELASELDLTNAELAAGISRVDALRKLERRTGVEDLSGLVNVLGVVERFGAGIAQSLRAHAQLTRRHRALEAERRAANASPALTVVMILFVLPVLFVVLLGPTVVNVVTFVLPSLQGG